MIYQSKESSIEFSVDVSGVDTKDMFVRFVVEMDKMDLSFNCSSENKKLWACTIPPLKFVEKTTYPYRIEVCVDGYYFKGTTGSVTVATSAELYVSDVKPLKAPTTKKEETKEQAKDEVKKQESKKENAKKEDSSKKQNNESFAFDVEHSSEVEPASLSNTPDIVTSTMVEKDALIKNILRETIGDMKTSTPPKPLFIKKLR